MRLSPDLVFGYLGAFGSCANPVFSSLLVRRHGSVALADHSDLRRRFRLGTGRSDQQPHAVLRRRALPLRRDHRRFRCRGRSAATDRRWWLGPTHRCGARRRRRSAERHGADHPADRRQRPGAPGQASDRLSQPAAARVVARSFGAEATGRRGSAGPLPQCLPAPLLRARSRAPAHVLGHHGGQSRRRSALLHPRRHPRPPEHLPGIHQRRSHRPRLRRAAPGADRGRPDPGPAGAQQRLHALRVLPDRPSRSQRRSGSLPRRTAQAGTRS